MSPELAAMVDREAIADVLGRYAVAADTRDWELMRGCFIEDAEVVGFAREPMHGVEAWLEAGPQLLARFGATQHLLGRPLVVIDGETATARTAVQAIHVLPDDPGALFVLWGSYLDAFVREGGRWLIRRHELVVHATQTTRDSR